MPAGVLAANPVMVQMYSSLAIRLWNIAVTRNLTQQKDGVDNARGMYYVCVIQSCASLVRYSFKGYVHIYSAAVTLALFKFKI